MTEISGAADPPEDPGLRGLERKLEEARKELLETSTRSRLLHTPLGSSRAKIIEVQDARADLIFRMLMQEGKTMSFRAAPDMAGEREGGAFVLPQPEDDDVGEEGFARRHSGTKLQTALSSAKLQARLRSIAYDAQTVETEQGVNILYLALGFLKWFEPRDFEKPRYAPLILIPVTLSRASANERYKIAYSGEELATNLSVQQRLKEEGIELPDLPDVDDLLPATYAGDVARRIAGMPTWEVHADALVLGLFSFAKFMMYRDLEPDRWPLKGGLRDHPLIRGLLGDGFHSQGEPLPSDEAPVDTLVDIASAGHVVDADSSQMIVIEAVRKGRDLVVQGPPGTGKSQTITNLIASAVHQGKRVLFVAEKIAALNVVRGNLDRVHLGQITLELHSHKAKKKVILEDLERTYELPRARPVAEGDLANQLRAARDTLNAYVDRIHTPLERSAITPFEIFGKLARLAGTGLAAPDFQIPAARSWARRDIDDRAHRAEQLADHVRTMGIPCQHPWRGVCLDIVLPPDAERFGSRAQILHSAFVALADRGAALGARAKASCATVAEARRLILLGEAVGRVPRLDAAAIADAAWSESRSQITQLVAQGLAYAAARRRLDGVLAPEGWEEDLTGVQREFAAHGNSWLRWLKGEYRAAVRRFRAVHVGPAPKLVSRRLAILEILAAGQRARGHIRAEDALGRSAFGSNWRGERSDWATLETIEIWEGGIQSANLPPSWRRHLHTIGDLAVFAVDVQAFARDVEARGSELGSFFHDMSFDVREAFGDADLASVPLSTLRDRLGVFGTAAGRLQQWCTWRIWCREARDAGIGDIVDRLADDRLNPLGAADLFRYACYEALARQVFSELPKLASFDGRSHERVVAEFKKLDLERLALTRREVIARHTGMMPTGGRELGEVGILEREWRKQRRHLPLRQLIKAAGRAMQLIKPVWMMSPMSLAQFVEPGALEFDLVVMDEASQVRPVEALGAIARGKQIVVVGDDKQLPPTSFFDRIVAEEIEPLEADDFQAADVESILGLCGAQGIAPRMLRWHYRSQHESLIAVSNLEFYNKRLFIVPSAESEGLGLHLRKVNGIYDRGRTATNRVEAREVARAVIEHARRYGRSSGFPDGMSLAVGTFSVAQRDAILDELEVLWRQHPELVAFFDPGALEPFFVKNLESIQGDERDVVFISIGYGPDVDGYVTMGFGPLSAQGGERRLNVLISRARRRCEVFSSITAADIDLSRTQSVGVRVLKTFLQYAETGHLDRSQVGRRGIDSDFEEDVGMALAALGYQVEHQVGVAGFFVDMGVKDPERPGHYLVGIECDGAAYHSARSARDRDRLREEVLRDRGWRIHRVWGPDWFRRRHEELQRAVGAIETARSAGCATPPQAWQLQPAPETTPTGNPGSDGAAGSPVAAGSPARTAYVEANLSEQLNVEPHELPLLKLMDILIRIVTIEGPIHEEEIGRRYASVCGKERTGSRIHEAAMFGLARATRESKLHAEGSFYALEPLTECSPRDRSATRSGTLRRPEMLPPIEIRTGLRQIIVAHVGVEPRGAVIEVARMLGFQRTGPDLLRVIEDQLRALLGEGILVLRNGNRLYMA